ncbi:nucleoside hydrolase [Paenibacillus urinalis]|uniref:Nucleoside hydrolase n=1 Tax=Paenibacillus urinalis TaxID=521520 RepID=A0AAX3N1A4_9BACL|nr:nucleoside hydrolase [Paenibacillus urinalis]WDH82402.1 nucleoside hydrolase [Paenibacillus urinalis]WDH98461.1 nucleoside hydrolase [Paenibacillus urinalis]WDI02150.1 nucleoside hydrolase [Paenibacillus urinalis]
MNPILLDVDTGIDDALAIMLAVQTRKDDIACITTVCGNVSLDQATENTCKILEFMQADQIPVYRGSESPLIRKSYYEHRVHGQDGLGGALKEYTAKKQADSGFAPDRIIETVMQRPGEVTLIMTGPLTNLALALLKQPDLVKHVREVIFMGGVVKGMGNVTPVAEYNTYADPEAARIVLQAGFPKLTQVGLDVTRQTLLTEAHIERLTIPAIKEYVAQSTAIYIKRYEQMNGVRACALHDPLAVGVALNPDLVTRNTYYVDVETASRLCDGQMVCDFQNRLGQEANVLVCEEVNQAAFLEHFIEALNKPIGAS